MEGASFSNQLANVDQHLLSHYTGHSTGEIMSNRLKRRSSAMEGSPNCMFEDPFSILLFQKFYVLVEILG